MWEERVIKWPDLALCLFAAFDMFGVTGMLLYLMLSDSRPPLKSLIVVVALTATVAGFLAAESLQFWRIIRFRENRKEFEAAKQASGIG
jgi:uncharacterized integral membrane protein